MAITGHLAKLVFGGRLFGDEWATTIHLLAVADKPPLIPSAFIGPLSTWVGNSNCHLNGGAKIDYVKVNRINPVSGQYFDQNSAYEALIPSGVGNNGAAFAAPQLTVAISLLTDFARGRGHAGRVYPPSDLGIVGPDGLITAAAANQVADSFRTLLNQITTASAGFVPVVYSKLAVVAIPIKSIRVGRVVDTQRRRRSELAESYTTPLALA